jgi:AraC-like DNA-binding protein
MESPWGQIEYKAPIVVDRNAKRAYMVGISKKLGENIKYVLCIDYGKQDAAQLTLYYTNELPEYEFNMMLDSDGNLVMSGGSMYDNFKPSAAVYLLPLGKCGNSNSPCNFHLSSFIPWIVGGFVLLLLVFIVLRRRKKHLDEESEIHANMIDEESDISSRPVLMENISKLMEEQKMFLNSDLKVSDIAAELGTNSRYVSNCIKLGKNVTFKQFVNGYRVDYAKQLMRQHPDMKLAVVGLKSGFSNEMTFFRTFKAYTGKTPKEWVLQFEEK